MNCAAPASFGNWVMAKVSKSSSEAKIALISVAVIASIVPLVRSSIVVNCERKPPIS